MVTSLQAFVNRSRRGRYGEKEVQIDQEQSIELKPFQARRSFLADSSFGLVKEKEVTGK
jgi:hypothetical protein